MTSNKLDQSTDVASPGARRSTPNGTCHSEGVALIAAERRRQVDVEGWTADHDDEHAGFELSQAASCYALAASYVGLNPRGHCLDNWPWDRDWWNPLATGEDGRVTEADALRMLVKSGALIAAEIDRLHRAGVR